MEFTPAQMWTRKGKLYLPLHQCAGSAEGRRLVQQRDACSVQAPLVLLYDSECYFHSIHTGMNEEGFSTGMVMRKRLFSGTSL